MGQIALGQIAGSFLNGAWVLGKDYLLPAAWMLGKEYNQHRRSNYLHQENLAQMLRIHEAEAHAAMEYHRVAMRMANEEHEKGITQARIMHEEDMDLEKRIAVRENLRDEWTQLTERAGTVLIVNTLVLSVAFGMLIDGPLPESITLTQPALVVAYFCLLSSSINLLLCSVRFAMLLRFRIGKIIVGQMKEAIHKSTELDAKYRDSLAYTSFNKPAKWVPACDDEERRIFVQPLTAQLGPSTVDVEQSDAEGGRDLAFVVDVPDGDYRNLKWLSQGTGYGARAHAKRDAKQMYRSACRRRARQQDMPTLPEATLYGATDGLQNVLSNCPRIGDVVLTNIRSRFPEASETEIITSQPSAEASVFNPRGDAVALANKGFTVKQLLTFYMSKEIHGDQLTEDVVNNYIIPETEDHATCYMESGFMKEHGGPQRAITFVSHAWKARFLNTVLNILLDASGLSKSELQRQYLDGDTDRFLVDKALDPRSGLDNDVLDKTYWLCIFAINQRTGEYENDKFEDVLASMKGHVVSLDLELHALERLWIMAEINEAVKSKPVRFRSAFSLSDQVSFKLRNGDSVMTPIVDCKVTDPLDKRRIMNKIDACDGSEAFDDFMKCIVELNFGILHYLPRATGEATRRLARLHHLDMDCTWDRGITSLADLGWSRGWEKLMNVQNLRINFNGCRSLTDVSQSGHIFQYLKSLQHVDISFFGCANLADVSHIGRALQESKHIRTFRINLKGCFKLNENMQREFRCRTDFLKVLHEAEYQQALQDRWDQDHDLQKALEGIRDSRCKPWDQTALALFFGGSLCLIFAACLLVMGRFLFPIVPLPPGAETFPPAKLAAIGFLCPCLVTGVVYMIVHKQEEDVESYVKEVIGETAASSRNIKATSGSPHNQFLARDAAGSPLSTNLAKLRWKKIRLAWQTVNHWKKVTEQEDTSSRFSSSENSDLNMHFRTRSQSKESNDSNKAFEEIKDKLPYKTMYIIFAAFLFNFMILLVAASLSGPPEMPLAPMKEEGATPALLPAPSPAYNPTLLTPVALTLAKGAAWPTFWEPAGATWWPSQKLLLLVGGMSVVELHMHGGSGRGPGAWLSEPRRLAGMSPFADVCVASDDTAQQPIGASIWLASTDASFTVFRADELSQADASLKARHLFPDSSRASGKRRVPSVPLGGFARSIRAMTCSYSGSSRLDEDDAVPSTQMWLAANEGPWPVVIGAEAALSNHSAAGASAELRWRDTVHRWPTQWLTVERSIAAALSGGIIIESIEVVAAGSLLLLVTDAAVGQGKKLQQLIVAVDSTGHLFKWWKLAPPGGVLDTPAAILGVRRWVALAADRAESQLFLVGSGPQPIVATVPLPEW